METTIQRAMEYVQSDSHQDDLGAWVRDETDRLLSKLSEISPAKHEKDRRTLRYDEESPCAGLLDECWQAAHELGYIVSVISFYGKKPEHREMLESMFAKLIEASSRESELESAMRWYPICLLFWQAGVNAVAGENYEMLKTLFYAKVRYQDGSQQDAAQQEIKLLEAVAEGLRLLHDVRGYKGKSQSRTVDRSHCFYNALRPSFEELAPYFFDSELPQPAGYELFFDRLEIYQVIVHDPPAQGVIGNVFAGHFSNVRPEDRIRLAELYDEIKKQGENWPPHKSGLFEGSLEEIVRTIDNMRKSKDASG